MDRNDQFCNFRSRSRAVTVIPSRGTLPGEPLAKASGINFSRGSWFLLPAHLIRDEERASPGERDIVGRIHKFLHVNRVRRRRRRRRPTNSWPRVGQPSWEGAIFIGNVASSRYSRGQTIARAVDNRGEDWAEDDGDAGWGMRGAGGGERTRKEWRKVVVARGLSLAGTC